MGHVPLFAQHFLPFMLQHPLTATTNNATNAILIIFFIVPAPFFGFG